MKSSLYTQRWWRNDSMEEYDGGLMQGMSVNRFRAEQGLTAQRMAFTYFLSLLLYTFDAIHEKVGF